MAGATAIADRAATGLASARLDLPAGRAAEAHERPLCATGEKSHAESLASQSGERECPCSRDLRHGQIHRRAPVREGRAETRG